MMNICTFPSCQDTGFHCQGACKSYEGDKAAYKHENSLLRAEVERLRGVVMGQGVKVGLLLAALSEIDDLAVSHTKGAIGKAQKIARRAMAEGTATTFTGR